MAQTVADSRYLHRLLKATRWWSVIICSGYTICLLLHLLVWVTGCLKNELWDTPPELNHYNALHIAVISWGITWIHGTLWLAFVTWNLRNQVSSPAQLAGHWHPSNYLLELMNPSVTVINSLPTLQLGLSGADIWELQKEWRQHEFQI